MAHGGEPVTPDDLAAIRRDCWATKPSMTADQCTLLELADALEQAWAERDRQHAKRWPGHCCPQEYQRLSERAERAEQIVAGLQFSAALATEERNRAEAALARVQEMRSKEFAELVEARERAKRAIRHEGEARILIADLNEDRHRIRAALVRLRALCDRYAHVAYGIDASEIRAAIEGA